MQITLDDLSSKEYDLYTRTESLEGTFDQKAERLLSLEIASKYKELYKLYFQLVQTTNDVSIKIESLKRMTFLNWIAQVEPSVFTGIGDLDDEAVFQSFSEVDILLGSDNFDREFRWMLSYYSCWEWTILYFSDNKLEKLTKFVNSVDQSVLHLPSYQVRKATMVNRGQMGIYFLSLAFDI